MVLVLTQQYCMYSQRVHSLPVGEAFWPAIHDFSTVLHGAFFCLFLMQGMPQKFEAQHNQI